MNGRIATIVAAFAIVALVAASLLVMHPPGSAGTPAPTRSPTPVAAVDLAPAAPAAVTACLSTVLVTLTPPSAADLETVMITRAAAEAAALASRGLTSASGAAVTWRTVGPTYLGWFSMKEIDVPATTPELAYLVPVLGNPVAGLPIDRALVPVQSSSGVVEESINVDWDAPCRGLLFGSEQPASTPTG